MMAHRRFEVWILTVALLAVSAAWAGDQPTTPTRSLSDEIGQLVRERLAEYQPLIDQLRKRSGSELQKLQQWQYKVIAAKTSDPDELTTLLNTWGAQGWECFHITSGAPPKGGGLPTEYALFLRKRKGSWIAQLPLRDILRLLLFISGESDEMQNAP